MNKYEEALNNLYYPKIPNFKDADEANPYLKIREESKFILEELIDRVTPMPKQKVDHQPYFDKHCYREYTCPKCHSRINANDNFCHTCGQALKASK